jgi:uncharacterized protein YchJ
VPTAKKLMRSRYAAYFTQEADYLIATTHSSTIQYHRKGEILNWASDNEVLLDHAIAVVAVKLCHLLFLKRR